jgi:hypothetical protein
MTTLLIGGTGFLGARIVKNLYVFRGCALPFYSGVYVSGVERRQKP